MIVMPKINDKISRSEKNSTLFGIKRLIEQKGYGFPGRKGIKGILVLSLLFSMVISSSIAEEVKMKLNCRQQRLKHSFVVRDGCLYVPLKELVPLLGLGIKMDGSDMACINKDGEKITLTAGLSKVTVGEKILHLKRKPLVIDHMLMLPVEALKELGIANVKWDAKNHECRIKNEYKYTDSPAMIEALREMDNAVNKDTLMWIASMYDPETGGFFYSRSARDNIQFHPDIESTSQAIAFLKTRGLTKTMPEKIRCKLLKFFTSRFDKNTGYYYDPQFGTAISDNKKFRNYWQAKKSIDFLKNLNSSHPKEELVKTNEKSKHSAPSKRPLPEYLQSDEKALAWLNSLDWRNNTYKTGHRVGMALGEIKRSGKLNLVLDFVERKQNPETGLWGPKLSYTEVSAAMKLSSLYYHSKRPFPRLDKMFDSLIYVIENRPAHNAFAVRNPFDLIRNFIVNGSHKFSPARDDVLEQKLPEIIKLSAKKMFVFKRNDNGYSFFPYGSSPVSQGAQVCLGLNEGDMNTTVMMAGSCVSFSYLIAGHSSPPDFCKYSKEFWNEIQKRPKRVVRTGPAFHARVDIDGGHIVLKPLFGPDNGYLKNITWGDYKKRKYSLTGLSPAFADDNWTKISFSFTPESSGSIKVNLLSNWSKTNNKKKRNAHWIYYDMITITGAKIKNGDFERIVNGKPEGWICNKSQLLKNDIHPFSGKYAIKAWHDMRCSQILNVKKGQKITITLYAKAGEFQPANY